jgi:hypothetical protein
LMDVSAGVKRVNKVGFCSRHSIGFRLLYFASRHVRAIAALGLEAYRRMNGLPSRACERNIKKPSDSRFYSSLKLELHGLARDPGRVRHLSEESGERPKMGTA